MLQGYAANLQASILDKESSGDYTAVNSLGYAGGYQFGASALETLGYLKPGSSSAGNKAAMADPANWTGKGNASSLDDFLNNPALQDDVFQQNIDFNLNVLKKNGKVSDLTPRDQITGLLAASHLLGAGGASNDLASTDANGTSGQDYYLMGVAAYSPQKSSSNDFVQKFFSKSAAGITQAEPTPAGEQDDVVTKFFRGVSGGQAATTRAAPVAAQPPISASTAVANKALSLGRDSAISGAMVLDNATYNQSLGSSDLVETFRRGMNSGAESLGADLSYMAAGIEALLGDKEGVNQSIENARIQEEFAAIPMEGMQTFGEFVDEPTIGGFFEQVASGTGQLVPSVISTISGAGVGSVAMLLGKETLKQSSRQAAKNIIKDSLVAVSRKQATPDQTDIAQAAFEATKEAHVLARNGYLRKKTAQQGALIGAGLSEYAPLSGSNVSEALESGRELDAGQAVRAGLVALPQAAVGLFGEVGLLKLISKQASAKSAGPNSVMGRLAAAVGGGYVKGGALEGGAELVQEEIAIRNRMDMDSTFTDADANLRRMNAGFVGFFGGGAAGGAGSLAVQGAREIGNVQVLDAAAAVTEKAADMADSVKEFMTRTKAQDDIASGEAGQTTQESQRDINAQIGAMLDPTSSKEAVWISGTEPDPKYSKRANKVKQIFINGKEVYAAFVPGRGTIISADIDVVESVVKGQASDAVLAAALGYSTVKTGTETGVFRVYDRDGGIVSEQAVDVAPESMASAKKAAEGLKPDGGRVEFMTTEDAIADRARRAEPDVKFMDDDEDAESDLDDDLGDDLDDAQDSSETQGDQEFEPETRTHSFLNKGETTESYQAVEGDNNFDGVEEARAAYSEMLGYDVDFSTPFYKRMSKSTLNTAVALQKANTDEVVQIAINSDGSYRIDIETTPDTQKIRIRDKGGVDDEVSMSEFLRRSISKAAGSLQKFRTVNITAPGSDKSISVNPVDLMNAGRRIMESLGGTFTGTGATQSSREGLLAMLGELQMRGYEVDIQGVPIADIMANLADPTKDLDPAISGLTVGFNDGGKPVKLGSLLKPYVPGAPTVTKLEEITDGLGDTTLVSEEAAREAAQDEDPIEPFDMAENNARTPDGIPLTTMNIEDERNVNTAQNRPIGSAPITGPAKDPKPQLNLKSGVTFPFGEVNQIVASLVRRLSRRLKLKTPVALISLKKFNESTRDQLASYITAKGKLSAKGKIAMRTLMGDTKTKPLDLSDKKAVGEFVQQLQKDGLLKKTMDVEVAKVTDPTLVGHSIVQRAAFEVLQPLTNSSLVAKGMAEYLVDSFDKQNRKGFHRKYDGATVIMLNDLHNVNQAALAMVAAHEMGHALFNEEIDGVIANKQLFSRLVRRFEQDRQAARDADKPIPQWETEGFEEWYADQVAAWAKKDMLADKRGANNAVDSHFKRVARLFKQLWQDVKSHNIFRRTDKVAPEFNKYMADVTKARRANREVITAPVRNEAGEIVAYAAALRSAQPTAPVQETAAAEATNAASPTEQAALDLQPQEGGGSGNDGGYDGPPPQLPVPDEPSWEQKALVAALKNQINLQSGAEARAEAWRRKFAKWQKDFLQNNPHATTILGIVRTADGMLRMTAGDVFADMFYVRSNTRSGLGFVQARQLARDKWRAGLFEAVGTDWTTQEVQDALKEAQSRTPTADLKQPKAKAIREYLEKMHREYVEPSNSDIGFRQDYFPVLLSLPEIANDPKAFVDLVMQYNPKADRKAVAKTVERLGKYQRFIESDQDVPSDIDALNPGAAVEKSIQLTRDIPLDVLAELGFAQEPEVALMNYVDNITKRVEWNRATKDSAGKDKVGPALAAMTKAQRANAESVLNAYVGNVTHLSPFWRKTNSYLATLNLVTLLPFATLASIPDFAGAIVQTKEFNGFGMALKQIMSTIKDKEAAKRFANDIGVVMPEAAANAWMSQADSDMLDPTARLATDKFFKWTGLSGLTNLSREFASGMGKRFLIEHANNPSERSERYLRQLGVTYDQVRRWEANDFSFEGEDGQAVKEALQRFVESSVLRPNAAERPIWASDPRFALIWQMKSFIYAFNSVILTGLEREGFMRFMEGKGLLPAMAPILLLTLAAFMPLAALGLELREYAKVGLSYAIPGIDGSLKYLRSDHMDYGTYFVELFGRAGLDGPLGLITMAQRSGDWGGSSLATLLGPTAELVDKVIQDGPFDGAYTRMNSPQEVAGTVLGIGAIARTLL